MGSTNFGWLSAKELRKRILETTGIGEGDLLRVVAHECLWSRLVASGFCEFGAFDGATELSATRARIDNDFWLPLYVIAAAPTYASSLKEGYACCHVDWGNSLFQRACELNEGPHIFEEWTSVHFDELSVKALISELQERSRTNILQDYEIDSWITHECKQTNIKAAWSDFKAHFGDKACKRDPTFRDAWRRVKGLRSRGRPKKDSNNPQWEF